MGGKDRLKDSVCVCVCVVSKVYYYAFLGGFASGVAVLRSVKCHINKASSDGACPSRVAAR